MTSSPPDAVRWLLSVLLQNCHSQRLSLTNTAWDYATNIMDEAYHGPTATFEEAVLWLHPFRIEASFPPVLEP
jgi:hypothetical protein